VVLNRKLGKLLRERNCVAVDGRRVSWSPLKPTEDEMAKTTKATKAQAKDQKKPAAEGNRYTRAARVLAKNDTIDVATLADRAFMSETTAARCKEAWDAVIAALIEVGRLPDPAKTQKAQGGGK
jgi:hypothetical protein